MGSNFMNGKSIMNMSLPVEIFHHSSLIQQFANFFGFVPQYIPQASNCTNILQQMQLVILSIMFSASIQPIISKPFNPILGETYQSICGGLYWYFEQISHHPPITAYLCKTKEFEISGTLQISVSLGLNAVYCVQQCICCIKFHKMKTQYIIKNPDVEISGLIKGDRCYKITGKGFVYEKINDLFFQCSFGKTKKGIYESKTKLDLNQICGGIYKVNNSFGKKFMSSKMKNFIGLKQDDIVERYTNVSGIWYDKIYFNGIQLRSLKQGPYPIRVELPIYKLPSDCSFRTDILYKKINHLKQSQQEKQYLENLQRNDRKLRQQWKKNNYKSKIK